MATIEERARDAVRARFSAFERRSIERAVYACYEVATEQDRISRAEERERCNDIVLKKLCEHCPAQNCTDKNYCYWYVDLRKAIKGE